MFSGCQDAEAYWGRSFQPAAKVYVSALFDKVFSPFFVVCAYVCISEFMVLVYT